jgi:hypothetical protein
MQPSCSSSSMMVPRPIRLGPLFADTEGRWGGKTAIATRRDVGEAQSSVGAVVPCDVEVQCVQGREAGVETRSGFQVEQGDRASRA